MMLTAQDNRRQLDLPCMCLEYLVSCLDCMPALCSTSDKNPLYLTTHLAENLCRQQFRLSTYRSPNVLYAWRGFLFQKSEHCHLTLGVYTDKHIPKLCSNLTLPYAYPTSSQQNHRSHYGQMFMAILVFVNSHIFLLLLTRTMNFPGITFFYTSPGVFFFVFFLASSCLRNHQKQSQKSFKIQNNSRLLPHFIIKCEY